MTRPLPATAPATGLRLLAGRQLVVVTDEQVRDGPHAPERAIRVISTSGGPLPGPRRRLRRTAAPLGRAQPA